MKPSALTPEQTALHETLRAEFERLNQAHFAQRLTQPGIIVSTRKTFGGYYQPSRHRIVVSWQAYLEHGLLETMNTFRHEVAHIVHPNHSKAFWELANRLGCIQRHASKPLKPCTTFKYVYECPNCNCRLLRRRRLRKASCGACDKKYNPQYALRLIASEAP